MQKFFNISPHASLFEKQRLLICLIAVFTGIGFFFVRHSIAWSSTTWMIIYHPSDFNNLGQVASFLHSLRIPIPPVISVFEILNFLTDSSTLFINKTCYRIALVLQYVLAFLIASSSMKRLLTSFFLSLIFLWGTIIIHPINPYNYDIFFPLFSMLFIVLLKYAINPSLKIFRQHVVCFFCGFFLSMTELTRPFVMLMLPIILGGVYVRFRTHQIKNGFLIFLLPLIVFSGGWHLHLAIFHRQFLSSNHSGFNLLRAWPHIPMPILIEEFQNHPIKPGRWENLNTPEHYENSVRLQKAILHYWIRHPGNTLALIIQKIHFFISAPTYLMGYDEYIPQGTILPIYKMGVTLSASISLISSLFLICSCILHPYFFQYIFQDTDNLLIFFTVMCIFFCSVGESGEEFRFRHIHITFSLVFTAISSKISVSETSSDSR